MTTLHLNHSPDRPPAAAAPEVSPLDVLTPALADLLLAVAQALRGHGAQPATEYPYSVDPPDFPPSARPILAALRDGPLLGKALARKLGAAYRSAFRAKLRRLLERGLVANGHDAGGYRLTALGRAALGAPAIAAAPATDTPVSVVTPVTAAPPDAGEQPGAGVEDLELLRLLAAGPLPRKVIAARLRRPLSGAFGRRLRDLERAGLVLQTPQGHRLTDRGRRALEGGVP